MNQSFVGTVMILAMGLAGPVAAAAPQQAPASPVSEVRRIPDLADQLAGTYQGEVISDARGSSRSDVTITVARTGKNAIRVTSDYARIPPVSIALTKAMNSIIAASGPHVVVVNLATDPNRMDLTIDDVSWSGVKSAAR